LQPNDRDSIIAGSRTLLRAGVLVRLLALITRTKSMEIPFGDSATRRTSLPGS
jgi:hypothetical protein